MKVLFFLGLLFLAPLIWDASSSASANRGLQPLEVLPAMKIQVRLGGTSSSHFGTIEPGESLYFSRGSQLSE